MADEDKKSPDEYEYPPEEYYKGGEYIPPDESADSLEAAPSTRANFLSKRMLLLGGFIIAIVLVYLILSFTTARRTAELAQPTPSLDTAASASIPSTPTTPVTPTQQAAPLVSPPPDAALQNMAQQSQINQQTMADLQNQVQQLQAQLNTLTNSMSTLTNQIQVISNEIRAIGTDRALQGKNLGLVAYGTAYQLKALVPGRAWLQSRNGNTTSVTVGDRLPGYGIVQMINTQQGIVTTSSGAIIQYGPKDS